MANHQGPAIINSLLQPYLTTEPSFLEHLRDLRSTGYTWGLVMITGPYVQHVRITEGTWLTSSTLDDFDAGRLGRVCRSTLLFFVAFP